MTTKSTARIESTKRVPLHRRVHSALLFSGLALSALACSAPRTFAEEIPATPDNVAGFLAAGEIGAARDQARELDLSDVQKRAVLAGTFGADFDSLIDLIQKETSGPWLDVDAEGGTIDPFESGVRVDAQGLLARVSRQDATGELATLRKVSRAAALNEDMARASQLRMVSLTRLEAEVARRLADGKSPAESMLHLAGLSQVQYVFVYPEEGEIVIAGPAAGWSYDEYGKALGANSGRPPLQLDDLVTVLRCFSSGGRGMFGCSIDPQPEGIQKVKDFVASQGNNSLNSTAVRGWAQRLGKALGPQTITVYGVPANSRTARVLVEADYRMKLIGIGLLNPHSQIPDYFDLLAKNPEMASGRLDALRWWMTMKYDAVMNSADMNSYQIQGSAVLCQSENQFLKDNGERVNTGKSEPLNELFASKFTQHYAELAKADPVFADLQGIFDLALVAALIQRDGLDQKAEWNRGVFASNGSYRPQAYPTPRQTDSVVNYRVLNGRDVVVQVAGGVRGDIASVLDQAGVRQTASPRLSGLAEHSHENASELPEGRWWWDAE